MNPRSLPAKAGFSLSKSALLLGGALLALRLMRARRAVDFRGRVVIITGGSRGLGLNIARELATQDAKLVLVAQESAELAIAEREIQTLGAQVLTVAADLTQENEIEPIIRATIARFGHIDALVNDAGIIQVGPLENMEERDFAATLDLHVWAVLRLCRAAAPYLKKSGSGRIVNIASFGGLIAVPHMAPYSVSKFALVGLSDALRSELAKDGVRVTTVCPGLIRTGSHLAAKFKGRHELEYKMFKLGASLPIVTVEAPKAARQIVEAMRYGDPSLTFPALMGYLAIFYRVFPNLSAEILNLIARFMPAPNEKATGDQTLSGHELDADAGAVPFGKLADAAALANNEKN